MKAFFSSPSRDGRAEASPPKSSSSGKFVCCPQLWGAAASTCFKSRNWNKDSVDLSLEAFLRCDAKMYVPLSFYAYTPPPKPLFPSDGPKTFFDEGESDVSTTKDGDANQDQEHDKVRELTLRRLREGFAAWHRGSEQDLTTAMQRFGPISEQVLTSYKVLQEELCDVMARMALETIGERGDMGASRVGNVCASLLPEFGESVLPEEGVTGTIAAGGAAPATIGMSWNNDDMAAMSEFTEVPSGGDVSGEEDWEQIAHHDSLEEPDTSAEWSEVASPPPYGSDANVFQNLRLQGATNGSWMHASSSPLSRQQVDVASDGSSRVIPQGAVVMSAPVITDTGTGAPAQPAQSPWARARRRLSQKASPRTPQVSAITRGLFDGPEPVGRPPLSPRAGVQPSSVANQDRGATMENRRSDNQAVSSAMVSPHASSAPQSTPSPSPSPQPRLRSQSPKPALKFDSISPPTPFQQQHQHEQEQQKPPLRVSTSPPSPVSPAAVNPPPSSRELARELVESLTPKWSRNNKHAPKWNKPGSGKTSSPPRKSSGAPRATVVSQGKGVASTITELQKKGESAGIAAASLREVLRSMKQPPALENDDNREGDNEYAGRVSQIFEARHFEKSFSQQRGRGEATRVLPNRFQQRQPPQSSGVSAVGGTKVARQIHERPPWVNPGQKQPPPKTTVARTPRSRFENPSPNQGLSQTRSYPRAGLVSSSSARSVSNVSNVSRDTAAARREVDAVVPSGRGRGLPDASLGSGRSSLSYHAGSANSNPLFQGVAGSAVIRRKKGNDIPGTIYT